MDIIFGLVLFALILNHESADPPQYDTTQECIEQKTTPTDTRSVWMNHRNAHWNKNVVEKNCNGKWLKP